jgi:general secretion pathway protein B
MSYILEALRKSDAERERGTVPDLHAQSLTLAGADDAAGPSQGRLWLWLAAGAGLLLVFVLAWRFSARDVPPMPAAAPAQLPVQALSPPPAVSTPPAVAAAIASAALPAQTPMPTLAVAPQASPTPVPTAKPKPTPTLESDVKAARKPVPRARAKVPAPVPAVVTTEPKPAASPPPERVPPLNELPDELRRQVPVMVIGGSVYSPQPARRMLIVNGQIYREGSPVAPELKVEQIGTKAAVFSIRGKRFEVPL